jgi:hypothetical protein
VAGQYRSNGSLDRLHAFPHKIINVGGNNSSSP